MDYLPEASHVDHYCKGQIEYRLPDKSRVDCLTDEYAIEYDWAKKHDECIGQALRYAVVTGRKPACVLIIKSPDDLRYLSRFEQSTTFVNVRLFTVEALQDEQTSTD